MERIRNQYFVRVVNAFTSRTRHGIATSGGAAKREDAARPSASGWAVQVAVQIGTGFTAIDPVPSDEWAQYATPCSPSGSEENGLPAAPTTATELTQTSITVTPPPATNALLEAVVQRISCLDGLVLSADDVRAAGRDLAPLTAAGIDQSRLTPGQAVQVAVDVAADGSLTLKGISRDQGAAGADDASQGQGTLTGS